MKINKQCEIQFSASKQIYLIKHGMRSSSLDTGKKADEQTNRDWFKMFFI